MSEEEFRSPDISNAAAACGDVSKLTGEEETLASLVADMRNGYDLDDKWKQLGPMLRLYIEEGADDMIAMTAKFLGTENEKSRAHKVLDAARALGTSEPDSAQLKRAILGNPEKYGSDWPDFYDINGWTRVFRFANLKVKMSKGGRD